MDDWDSDEDTWMTLNTGQSYLRVELREAIGKINEYDRELEDRRLQQVQERRAAERAETERAAEERAAAERAAAEARRSSAQRPEGALEKGPLPLFPNDPLPDFGDDPLPQVENDPLPEVGDLALADKGGAAGDVFMLPDDEERETNEVGLSDDITSDPAAMDELQRYAEENRKRKRVGRSKTPARSASRPVRKRATRSQAAQPTRAINYAIEEGQRGRTQPKVEIPPVADVRFLLPSGRVEQRSHDQVTDQLEAYWKDRVLKNKKLHTSAQTWLKAHRPDECLLCAQANTKSRRADDRSQSTACDTCLKMGRPCISSTPVSVFPLLVLPDPNAEGDEDAFDYISEG